MQCVLPFKLAIFFKLEAVGVLFFILRAHVIPPLAFRAGKGNNLAYHGFYTSSLVARWSYALSLILCFAINNLTYWFKSFKSVKSLKSNNGLNYLNYLNDLNVKEGQSPYFTTSETLPAPTVRPPSRTANRNPFSIAIGVISSHSIPTLSPGITISTPSGSFTTPVTSVVRK